MTEHLTPHILSETKRDKSTSTYVDNDIGYSCGPYIVKKNEKKRISC